MVIKNQKYARAALIIFTLTAILYNSWPLGYLLNPSTARSALASDLDGSGQPWYWLFIAGDVLVGVALISISLLIFFKLRRDVWSKAWASIFIGVILFGLFTATSAASTNVCSPGHILHYCATIHHKTVGLDGLESSMAALGLLISLIGINVMGYKIKLSNRLQAFSQVTLALWPISGLIFLIAADKNIDVHLAQQALLIISGLALFVIGLDIYAALENLASGSQDSFIGGR